MRRPGLQQERELVAGLMRVRQQPELQTVVGWERARQPPGLRLVAGLESEPPELGPVAQRWMRERPEELRAQPRLPAVPQGSAARSDH